MKNMPLLRLVGAAALSALAAFATPALSATPKDTLVIAWAIDDIITMDPAESFEISAGEIIGNAYDRLLRFDVADPSRLIGDTAAKWTVSLDGKTYTFELKPGLKFASGNPLTAEDVVYSLQRAVLLDKTPAFILTQFGFTKDNVKEKIKQTGPLTLTMETDKAYAPTFVLNCLTANVAAIVDKKLVQSKETNNDMGYGWLKTNYAGSGPFKIREWRANEIVVLERNDNYYGEKSKLARVIYRHVKEAATQRLLLEKGDIDIARNLTPQDLAAARQQHGHQDDVHAEGHGLLLLSLNQKNPTLAKPEVREAMKWLVDYAAIGDTLIKNIGVVHQTFLPMGLLGASDREPVQARRRQGQGAAGQGRPAQRLQGDDGRAHRAAGAGHRRGVPADGQAQAGIDVEIIPGDGKQTLTKYRARNHDIYIGQWGADYWDPHTNADTFARNPDNSDDAKSKPLAWRNAWAIPDLTKKSDAAVLERDAAKRKAMYEEIQAKFRKDSPFVMLYQQTEVAAFRSDVQGLKIGPTSDTTYMFRVSKT